MPTKVYRTGTLVFNERVIDDIQRMNDGFYLIGRSFAQFGIVHPWQVGPYKTIKEGLADIFTLCVLVERKA